MASAAGDLADNIVITIVDKQIAGTVHCYSVGPVQFGGCGRLIIAVVAFRSRARHRVNIVRHLARIGTASAAIARLRHTRYFAYAGIVIVGNEEIAFIVHRQSNGTTQLGCGSQDSVAVITACARMPGTFTCARQGVDVAGSLA